MEIRSFRKYVRQPSTKHPIEIAFRQECLMLDVSLFKERNSCKELTFKLN